MLTSLNYTLKADVYSFGVVLWECITREDAYPGMQTYEVIYSVAKEGLRPTIPQGIPHPYVYLMKRCWDENMDVRPHFQEILNELEDMKAYGWKGEPIKSQNSSKARKNKGNDNSERTPILGSSGNDDVGGKRKGMRPVCGYGSTNNCELGSLILDSHNDSSDY